MKRRMKPMWVDPDFHQLVKTRAAERGVTIRSLTCELAREARKSEDDLQKRGGFRFKL